jgi:two-component system, LytTR family, sensor kinase
VRRFPVNRDSWLRNVVVFSCAGLLLALARTLIPVLINFLVINNSAFLYSYLANKYFDLISDFLVALVVYALILTIGYALNYYKQYRENELKASQLAAQLAQSQLQALRMQIHPHFLFNSLNSISALQLEDVAGAQRMTARLGDFLRLTLENVGTQELSLKQEIEFVNCYLDIERVRFGKRLTTSIEIEPESLDAKVPNLILQPLIENAIQHGISKRIGPGRISITAKRNSERLELEIRDNGSGLAANGSLDAKSGKGMGLANTRARLDQLYGSNYRFDLANASEGGLIVTLNIPFKTNGKSDCS